MGQHIDYLSVALATVLYTVIFLCWYSKWLFGSGLPKKKGAQLFWNLLIGFCLAYFLAFFNDALQVTSVGDAMFTALSLWIGFVLPTQLLPLIWEKKSGRAFTIDAGFTLLALLVMGGILGA